MPVVKGRVGEKPVDVLRDTGCGGTVVKKDLVPEDQFTGDFNVMLLIDSTARKVPIAKIGVNTPYLKGQVEAQCLPYPIYDDPDPSCQDHEQEASTVTARSQAKMAGGGILLKISSTDESSVVDREKPKQKYVERSDKLCEPFKQVVDQIQKLSEALTQEHVRGAEREKAIRHLQGLLDDQQRKLRDVRCPG